MTMTHDSLLPKNVRIDKCIKPGVRITVEMDSSLKKGGRVLILITSYH